MRRPAWFFPLALAAVLPLQAQWQMLASNTTADLRGIHNVGNGVAWASGTHGTVLRTEDGGSVWQTCAVPPGAEKLDFRGVQAFDANTAIVMSSGPGDQSRLYKTTDGCHTWKLLFTNPDAPNGFFDCVYFPREQRRITDHEGFGLLLGDPAGGELAVFETQDGGHSWKRISGSALRPSKFSSGAFAASNSSISGFGGATFDFAVSGVAGSSLLRLSYRGRYWLSDSAPLERSWTKENIPIADGNDSSGAFSIARRIQFPLSKAAPGLEDLHLHEVVVGGDYLKPDATSGTAAYHQKAWHPAQTPPHGYRSAVAYDSDLKLWITVGPNGTDISSDDGRNWRAVHPGTALGEAPDADRDWNALSLPFVVGPHGRIGKLEPAALGVAVQLPASGQNNAQKR